MRNDIQIKHSSVPPLLKIIWQILGNDNNSLLLELLEIIHYFSSIPENPFIVLNIYSFDFRIVVEQNSQVVVKRLFLS